MAVQTLPLHIDYVAYADTTFRRQYRWLFDGTTPQDFTGWTARMLIGPEHGTADLELTDNTDALTLTADGLITITLTPDQTEALPATDNFHILDLTEPDTLTTVRFARGHLFVVHDLRPRT